VCRVGRKKGELDLPEDVDGCCEFIAWVPIHFVEPDQVPISSHVGSKDGRAHGRIPKD